MASLLQLALKIEWSCTPPDRDLWRGSRTCGWFSLSLIKETTTTTNTASISILKRCHSGLRTDQSCLAIRGEELRHLDCRGRRPNGRTLCKGTPSVCVLKFDASEHKRDSWAMRMCRSIPQRYSLLQLSLTCTLADTC